MNGSRKTNNVLCSSGIIEFRKDIQLLCLAQLLGSSNEVPHRGPKVIKLFSCSTQLSMEFYLLINIKLLISSGIFLLSLAECEIFCAHEFENANISWHFHIHEHRKCHAQLR